MADRTSTSPPRKVVIEGKTYEVRTVTQWKDGGRPGTIDDSIRPTVKVQYKEEGVFSQYKDLADRTENKSVNNGWSFRPLAGPGFKKALIEKGASSLSSQIDTATQNQVAKDAVVPVTRAQQVLARTSTTKTNQALAAANQDPTAPAGGQNVAQADQAGDNAKPTPVDLKKFGESVKSKDRENYNQVRSGAPNGYLIYPNDLATTKQDVIKFDIFVYRPRSFNDNKQFGFSPRERSFSQTKGHVILPIPSGISDSSNTCNWNGADMNAKDAALAQMALGGIVGGGEGFANQTEKVLNDIKSSDEAGVAFAAAFAEGAVGVQGLLTRTTGAIINPNMELLFQAPTLRPFSFTFKMSARNDIEAKTIISIIRFFKQGMSPQRSKSNLFLKSPNTFGIRYLHRPKGADEEHKYIGKIKECALTSFNVNYTPEGQYATFHDGVMVSYEMQMQFQELEPIFNDDYSTLDGDKDTEIGF